MGYSQLAGTDQLGRTDRTDVWWLPPIGVALGFLAFIVYSTWAAFQNAHFEWGPYLSPMYSPHLPDSFFPSIWPDFLPRSPAFLILWAPGGFRFTCYYYRKAYYRAFKLDPVACAVGERRKNYSGENKFPWILQNAHRYFMYVAVIFIFILAYDAILAYMWDDGSGGKNFGMGIGTIVLTINPILLGAYTFGCHALRHAIGGKVDCFSCTVSSRCRHTLWEKITHLTERHQLWAWCSLFWVGFTDLYIRLVSMGVWTDVRIF